MTSVGFREQADDPGALVWVLVSLYLCILLGIAVYSFFKSSGTNQLRDHFLAIGGLGDVVLMLTMFSTVYSGYTVVGVPEEMYRAGFFSYRWLFTVPPMVVVISFFGDRLNFLFKKRGYVSPTDFIGDRYNSHMLKVAISCTLTMPTIIYVLAQFDSMSHTVEGMSGGDLDGFAGAVILCGVMLVYELFGGLRAISWTDALQGGVMTFGFFMFYIVQEEIFDGVEEAGNYMQNIPPFTHVLPKDMQTIWFTFGCTLFFAYCFYPQMIQRYQAATTSHSFRKSMIFLVFGTWLAFSSSLATGMVAMHYFGFGNPNIGKNETFGAVLRVIISKGTGWNIFGSMIFTAALAAFMSTADSAINGASCCITLDLIQPYAKYYKYPFKMWCGDGGHPQRYESFSEWEMLIISKVTSIIIAVGALFLNKWVDYELGALLTMQNAVLCQVFPAYFLGMTFDFIQPYAVLCGWIFGIITTIVVQCDNGQDDCVRQSLDVDWYWPIENLHPSLFACAVNFCMSFGLSLVFTGRELSFDKIKSGHQFPQKLIGVNVTGKGTIRPWHFPYCFIILATFLSSIFAIPWYRGVEDGHVDTFKDGLPRYIRDGYVAAGISSFCTLIMLTFCWSGEPVIDEADETTQVEMWETSEQKGKSGTNFI